MYIDCDTHYFPVKFLEGISDQYPESPRVVRNGDEVKSVLPDGTPHQEPGPQGALGPGRTGATGRLRRVRQARPHPGEPGVAVHVGPGPRKRAGPALQRRRWPRTWRNAPIRSVTSASAGYSCRTRKSPARSSTAWSTQLGHQGGQIHGRLRGRQPGGGAAVAGLRQGVPARHPHPRARHRVGPPGPSQPGPGGHRAALPGGRQQRPALSAGVSLPATSWTWEA